MKMENKSIDLFLFSGFRGYIVSVFDVFGLVLKEVL